jgi:hypothetical protein
MGGGGSTYDYGFRIYNAQIGKFLSVDPLSDSYPWYTPYQFAGNKPIMCDDIDGLEEFIRTRYFDVAGNLYRTEIQVIGTLGQDGHAFTDPAPVQLVHETTVQADAAGNLNATYMGSAVGVRVPANSPGTADASGVMVGQTGANAPGSSLFTIAENQAIWDSTPRGATVPPSAAGTLTDRTYIKDDGTNNLEVVTETVITTPGGTTISSRIGNRDIEPRVVNNSSGIVEVNPPGSSPPANEQPVPIGANSTPATASGDAASPARTDLAGTPLAPSGPLTAAMISAQRTLDVENTSLRPVKFKNSTQAGSGPLTTSPIRTTTASF